jgi:DNA-binding response OmpR family regulator
MKLLCIEDNKALVASLRDYLAKSWRLKAAHTGEEGLEMARTGNYDVIILDLTLPDVHGRTVCKEIRAAQIDTPILILSGSAEADTKVNLLKFGADDYLTKQFNVNELHSRMMALLLRGHAGQASPHLLKVGPLTLDPLTRRVERAGQKIELRRKEFNILEYLMRNRGKVVTRPMIMDSAWDINSDSWNNTVDVHIKYLRDKIDRPYKHKLIHTAYGVGYSIGDEKS